MQTLLKKLTDSHPAVTGLTDLLRQTPNCQPFLVGGCVRDLLLGEVPKDLDIEVFGCPLDELESILGQRFTTHQVGKSFGVIKLSGYPIDVSVPRRESAFGPGHRDFDIEADPNLSLAEAAARRDFTLNAIYWDLFRDEIADPHNGIGDLHNRILRHTSDRFSEDPLRVYRAMQFVARFELDVHPDTLMLCRSMDADHLPRERVFEEFRKLILQGTKPAKGLEFLKACGWIRYFPELEALIGCEQDPHWHPEGDVWNHTLLCLDAFARHRTGDAQEDLIVGLAVLCHDMGKPETTVFERGHIRSPGHDEAGVAVAERFLRRLTAENDLLLSVPVLVATHMRPAALHRDQSSNSSIRRLALKVGRMDRLLRVCKADREGRTGAVADEAFPEGDWIRARLNSMGIADRKPSPLLQGRDLIARGLVPGPHFSGILDACFQAQLDGAFTNLEEAETFLDRFLQQP